MKDGAWTGVGTTATTIPAAGRFARFVLKYEANTANSFPQVITFSSTRFQFEE